MPLNTGPFNTGTFGVPLVPAPAPPPASAPAPDPEPATSLPASATNVATINPVYSITPIFAVTPGPQTTAGTGTGTVAGSAAGSQFVTFEKATYGKGQRGGVQATFPRTVTLPAIVALFGTPVRIVEGGSNENRPLARLSFKVTVDEDPGDSFGVPLATDDLIVWGKITLTVIGTAIPHEAGTGFDIIGELIA
jgi:hypothetical protein